MPSWENTANLGTEALSASLDASLHSIASTASIGARDVPRYVTSTLAASLAAGETNVSVATESGL